MASDTYDPLLGLLLMGTGNDNNSWGTNHNSFTTTLAAQAICGVNTITTVTGTVDLSTVVPPAGARLDMHHIQLMNGALTGDLTIQIPNVAKTWMFWNRTTNAHFVYVKVPGGVSPTGNTIGGQVQIPQNRMVTVICDGSGNLMRDDDAEIGVIRISGKASVANGELACDGSSLLRASYPDLFNKIGTTWGSVDGTHFTMPKFTDTNRYLRAADGVTLTVGTYQANQNLSHTHTLSSGTITGTTDSQGAHQHNVFLHDPGHTHTGGASNSGEVANAGVAGSAPPTYANYPSTGSANTGMTIGSVSGVANDNLTTSNGAHTHNVSGSVSALTLNTQGGTEARPESAIVLMGIRY